MFYVLYVCVYNAYLTTNFFEVLCDQLINRIFVCLNGSQCVKISGLEEEKVETLLWPKNMKPLGTKEELSLWPNYTIDKPGTKLLSTLIKQWGNRSCSSRKN